MTIQNAQFSTIIIKTKIFKIEDCSKLSYIMLMNIGYDF